MRDNKQRELKFRIWNGVEMVYDVIVGKFGAFYVNSSNNGIDERDSASLSPMNTKYPDGTPVMQSTGLLDKNGTTIYEGDVIVMAPDGLHGTVVWSDELALFEILIKDQGEEFTATIYSRQDEGRNTKREIIGNIY